MNFRENDEDFPANFLWCIEMACQKIGLSVTKAVEENKVISNLGGSTNALVFTFSPK